MTDKTTSATSSVDTEYQPWRWWDRVRELGEDEETARRRALRADSPITAMYRKMIKNGQNVSEY